VDDEPRSTEPGWQKGQKGLKEEGLKEVGLKEEGLKEEGLKEEGLKEKGLKEKGLKEKGLKEWDGWVGEGDRQIISRLFCALPLLPVE
jgi:hypothetical protein